jgi:hypothetical protein
MDFPEWNPDEEIVSSGEFYVYGRILDKSGEPIQGANAILVNSGLSAISGVDGRFIISGFLDSTQAGNAEMVSIDTLVIRIASPVFPADSSEVEKIAVSSGEKVEIPAIRLVLREIRTAVGDSPMADSIKAHVYDAGGIPVSGNIILRQDTTGYAGATAYFKYEADSEYSLIILGYDSSGNLIAHSERIYFSADDTEVVAFEDEQPAGMAPYFIISSDSVTSFSQDTIIMQIALMGDSLTNIDKVLADIGLTGTYADISDADGKTICLPSQCEEPGDEYSDCPADTAECVFKCRIVFVLQNNTTDSVLSCGFLAILDNGDTVSGNHEIKLPPVSGITIISPKPSDTISISQVASENNGDTLAIICLSNYDDFTSNIGVRISRDSGKTWSNGPTSTRKEGVQYDTLLWYFGWMPAEYLTTRGFRLWALDYSGDYSDKTGYFFFKE